MIYHIVEELDRLPHNISLEHKPKINKNHNKIFTLKS